MVDFLKKLKIIAKILATFRNNVYLCTQNNGRVPLLGLGCPRSEELSGSWRLFFYACWDG